MVTRHLPVLALFLGMFVASSPALADCGSDCSARCNSLGSGPAWARCMETCMKRCLNLSGVNYSIRMVALPECVDLGRACVLNGTPCCGTATCKGKFPNTTCQ